MAMNKTIKHAFLLALLVLGSLQLNAQKKYWVKLSDKNGTPFQVNNPSAFLSQKSIDRRIAFSIAVNQSDLPVTPAYIQAIDNVPNVNVLYASKWLNGVVISTNDLSALATIKTFSFVVDTSKVNRYKLDYGKNLPAVPFASAENKSSSSTTSGVYNYGYSYWQNKEINVDCLHNQGFRGTGFCIAVMDAGFTGVDSYSFFDSIRARGRILGTNDFVNGGSNVYNSSDHGTRVLSCMAAIKPGVLIGSAPDADYWLLKTEDVGSETLTEEYNWIRAAEFADSVGAHILTTSLGYTTFDNPIQNHSYSSLDGRTAPQSIAANMAARKGMFVVNSAGNEGASLWNYISVAADADSICAVGAVDSTGAYAAFSGKGPTFDGRIKPDLVARGAGTWVCLNSTIAFPANGTSFSGPLLAGAVACYWQAHRSFSNIKMLDTLRKTASNSANPNNTIGWGLPNMCAIPVGIKDYSNLSSSLLRLSPNPFQNDIIIEKTDAAYELIKYELIDLSGKVVLTESLKNTIKQTIHLQQVDKGFYHLKIYTSSGTLSKKVIKSE